LNVEYKRQSSTLKSLTQNEKEKERDGDLQASRSATASWQLSTMAVFACDEGTPRVRA